MRQSIRPSLIRPSRLRTGAELFGSQFGKCVESVLYRGASLFRSPVSMHSLRCGTALLGGPFLSHSFALLGSPIKHLRSPHVAAFLARLGSKAPLSLRRYFAAPLIAQRGLPSLGNCAPSLGGYLSGSLFGVGTTLLSRHTGLCAFPSHAELFWRSPSHHAFAALGAIYKRSTFGPVERNPATFRFLPTVSRTGFKSFHLGQQPDGQQREKPSLFMSPSALGRFVHVGSQAFLRAIRSEANVTNLLRSRATQRVDNPIHLRQVCAENSMFTRFKRKLNLVVLSAAQSQGAD